MIIILSWLRPCPTDKTCHYINRSLSLPRSAVLLLTFVGSVREVVQFFVLVGEGEVIPPKNESEQKGR